MGVNASLSGEEASRIAYFHPDAFIEYLRASNTDAVPPQPPGVTMHGKYKVKHSIVSLTPEEQREREAAANRLLVETMRKKKRKEKEEE